MTTLRTRRTLAGAAALALIGLGAIGCSAGDSGESSDSGGSSTLGDSTQEAPAAALAPGERGQADDGSLTTDLSAGSFATAPDASSEGAKSADDLSQGPSLIKVGNVALRSEDVAGARFDVQKVVDAYAGEVAERSTEAGKDGEEARARLVIRVPAADFDAALADVEKIGELLSSTGSAEDVSTQVIDTQVRVQLQRRSIERISILLDRAQSIRDIVSIERELSRREADLGSLEKRQAYLADQTSMGTITVSIERPGVKNQNVISTRGHHEDDGFVAGLVNGWTAFRSATVGLLTAVGAVLPFAVLLLLIGVPLRLLLRRSAAHRPTAPSAAPSAGPSV